MAKYRILGPKRATHPDGVYPNEPRWNGVLLATGTGFFVVFAALVTMWFMATYR